MLCPFVAIVTDQFAGFMLMWTIRMDVRIVRTAFVVAVWIHQMNAVVIAGNELDYVQRVTYQSRLVKHLMRPGEYDPRVRPVKDSFVPINVTVRINLYQVIEVNEYSQYVKIYVWMTQYWNDEFLTWNPKHYNGLETVVLPFQDVWLPDTYLYNSLQMKKEEVERLTTVIVTAHSPTSSLVTFRYPAIYEFTCNIDIYYFPFDKQSCLLTFGSWTYDATGIDYFPVQEDVFREDFIESEEWAVSRAKMERRLETYSCCPNNFSLLLVHLSLKRKPLFYVVNLVLPATVITLVAFVGFFCPDNSTGERKEKVNLGIGTLLAMSVLLLTTSNQMPTTSRYLPLLGTFYLYIIVFISLATITTCVIIKVETMGRYGKQMPAGLRHFFFVYIGNILCMPEPSVLKARPNYKLKKNKAQEGSPSGAFGTSSQSWAMQPDPIWMAQSPTSELSNTEQFGFFPDTANVASSSRHTETGRVSSANIARVSSRVNRMIEKLAITEEKRETILLEWQWLAMLLDRIFLGFYLTSLFVAISYLFLIGYLMSI